MRSDGIDVDIGGLPLAVGHGGGNAVDVHAHPAHAEHRTAAEPAYRHLQILRIVLPILDLQARHAAEFSDRLICGAALRRVSPSITLTETGDPSSVNPVGCAITTRVSLSFCSAARAEPIQIGCSNNRVAGVKAGRFLFIR
jgi:hypothetical protein